ncbi:MAG TPA: hypothetical protein VFG86_20540 [Chloroflexota bacterium]|nr:hypothetical protein [Chloroflexota bacterium]
MVLGRLPRLARALPLALTALLLAVGPGTAAPPLDTRFGVAEGFRNPRVMAELNAGWERLILPWDQIQPYAADDFGRLGMTISDAQLQAELDRGIHVVGLLEFTPGWAQSNPDAGKRSPPRNLELPFDDANNYWGRFVARTVSHYAGRIDDWVIWNEPDFHPGDPGAGGSFTWLGTDAEFAQLMKVGYLAAKRVNPMATVSFPGTSFWVDLQSDRPQFYERALEILSHDPDAGRFNYYHDVVSLNLYRAPDDIYRVYSVFKDIQSRYRIDKPVWLTETNAMPSDDVAIECPHADTAIQTTLDQQAAYAVQAFAMAAAAGYERFEIYQMLDQNACAEPAVWGITRDDGTRRPIADAVRTTIDNLSGYTKASFVPLVRETQPWSPWPDDPASLMPNWQVYQVAFDKPGRHRVTVLWNGDGEPRTVRLRKSGSTAVVVHKGGGARSAIESQGWWVVELPAATAHFPGDPGGYYFIGGDPQLLVEDQVEPGAPVAAPALGQPGSVAREFRLFASPTDQSVRLGGAAEFFISVRGYEGFNEPLTWSIAQWSSQRFPEPKDGSTLPLAVRLPGSTAPGSTATMHLETAGADPGIYYMTLQASGGGQTKSVDLALALS